MINLIDSLYRMLLRRAFSEKHKIRARKEARLWRMRHPELSKLRSKNASTKRRRLYPKETREYSKIAMRQWRKRNQELSLYRQSIYEAKRRAIKRQAKIENIASIITIYNRSYELRKQGFDVAVDHIIPLAKGGSHSPDNLQIIYAYEKDNSNYCPKIIFH